MDIMVVLSDSVTTIGVSALKLTEVHRFLEYVYAKNAIKVNPNFLNVKTFVSPMPTLF
jgi:hypothetical protein